MAYAALVSLAQTTHLILNHGKCSISDDERQVITSIREYVFFFISLLENSPEKGNSLEGKIRDLANEAEDLIEYFMGNQFLKDWSRAGQSTVELENLKRVKEEIGSISRDLTGDGLCDVPAAISSSRVEGMGKNDVVIGLDEDLIAIKGRLRGESPKLEVIPIVGMGGIGKTTLARNAYDDLLVKEYYDIRAFVQVSQDYSAIEFLSNVLVSINLFQEEMFGEKNESTIAEKVYKTLKQRRYLIVMDDIWSTNVLDDVRNMFPDDENGSRIMLTTRLSDVAAYASSGCPPHEMKFMDGNKSWNLLKRKVFTGCQDCPSALEHIGRAIAQGCRGLPLAVVLVAGILSTMVQNPASWAKIAKNVNSVVEGQLEKILSLSYIHLPLHLRPCFLFMGGFPEDGNIHVSRLLKLWVAEGFLKRQNVCKTLEEEAEEYLEDLVNRSLVLVTSRKTNGKIKSCSLHDLVRKMCIRKSQKEKFLLTDRYAIPEMTKVGRRISIGHSRLMEIWGPTIHTILCFQAILDCSSLAFLVKFRLLRVLDVIHDNSALLPPQVFDLFHLRYLALGRPNTIPAAISKLQNLETLIIRPYRRSGSYGSLASYLPQAIWSMPRLRHLVLTENCMLRDPPLRPTFPLENLQTLLGIASFLCSERILKMIPNLKKLGIIYSTNEGHQDLHSLVNLRQLEKLKITASDQRLSLPGQYLAFPLTLNKLTLDGGELPWKDMSIIGSLPNLQVLKLKNYACSGDTWETTDGEFSELKFLLIEYSNLKHWITESDHFPRLERILLGHCQKLTEIPDSIGDIPTLELIQVEVNDLNGSLVKSVKQIQEDQQSCGNDTLQVHCIHSKQPKDEENMLLRKRRVQKGVVPDPEIISNIKLLQRAKDENLKEMKIIKKCDCRECNLFHYKVRINIMLSVAISCAVFATDTSSLLLENERIATECVNEGSKLKRMELNPKFMKRSNLGRGKYQNGPGNSWR